MLNSIEQPNQDQIDRVEAVVSRCPSTATVLLALAHVLYGYDDAKGAELVAAFAREFWKHEQTTM